MDGRSRLDRYQNIRSGMSDNTNNSNFDNTMDMTRGNQFGNRVSANSSSYGNFSRNANGGYVKSAVTTDYDAMLKEHEDFLKSLDQQFGTIAEPESPANYSQSVIQQPVGQTVKQPVQQPSYQQPVYQQPVQQPQQAQYQQPNYQQQMYNTQSIPVQQPVFQQEVQQPVFQQPVYPQQPVFQQPVQEPVQQPTFQQPIVNEVKEIKPVEVSTPDYINQYSAYQNVYTERVEVKPVEPVKPVVQPVQPVIQPVEIKEVKEIGAFNPTPVNPYTKQNIYASRVEARHVDAIYAQPKVEMPTVKPVDLSNITPAFQPSDAGFVPAVDPFAPVQQQPQYVEENIIEDVKPNTVPPVQVVYQQENVQTAPVQPQPVSFGSDFNFVQPQPLNQPVQPQPVETVKPVEVAPQQENTLDSVDQVLSEINSMNFETAPGFSIVSDDFAQPVAEKVEVQPVVEENKGNDDDNMSLTDLEQLISNPQTEEEKIQKEKESLDKIDQILGVNNNKKEDDFYDFINDVLNNPTQEDNEVYPTRKDNNYTLNNNVSDDRVLWKVGLDDSDDGYSENISKAISQMDLDNINFGDEPAVSAYQPQPVEQPKQQPQIQPNNEVDSPIFYDDPQNVNELTQNLQRERQKNEELFEQTQQLQSQIYEYANEIDDVNNSMSKTNKILNTVLLLLIVTLFVILFIIGFFFAQDRGLI